MIAIDKLSYFWKWLFFKTNLLSSMAHNLVETYTNRHCCWSWGWGKHSNHWILYFSGRNKEYCMKATVLSQTHIHIAAAAKLLLKKAMAPHSSTLAWKIPWTEEPGGLQSMGSLRVGHNWATSLSLFTFLHWRRKWQPISVFLPGESQGRGSLMGWCLWGRTESDTIEAT